MEYSQKDNSIFKEVDSKASIADVIAYELGSNALIKKGKDYVCLCPFHPDHKPSMQINTARNTFKCWVDGEGGGPIHFVKEYEKISYIEALKKVCQICHIPLPTSVNSQREYIPQIEIEYKRELEALNELKKFYQAYLHTKEGELCREYLKKRNIPEEAIDHFSMGYAPSNSKLAIESLRKLGFDVQTLEKSGILSNSSELSDRYSSRLMYPIEDNYGHVVGFSGRKISEEQSGGKYVNYPATPLFNKSSILYHYYIAKTVAKKYGYIYVVEGFNDVIAFCRADIKSVVGTMGTALTKENALALKKLDVEIRLCLDNDEPGQKATIECIKILNEINAKFLVVRQFKSGKDADEVLANFKEKGSEQLNKEVNRTYDAFLFLLARKLKEKGYNNKISNPKDVQDFISISKPFYAKLDSISKETDLKALNKVSDIEIPTLMKLFESTENQIIEDKSENNNKKNIENEQTKYPTTYQNKRKFNKKDPFSPRNNEPIIFVNDNNLPQKKNIAKTLNDFVTYTSGSLEGSNLDIDLIKCECGIIYVLPHSREAYMLFSEAKCDLRYKPFNALTKIIYQVYSADVNKKSFDNNDYNYLRDFLNNYNQKHSEYLTKEKKEESLDFDFDIDGLDIEDFDENETSNIDDVFSIEISTEELHYLSFAIESIAKSLDTVYKKENLERELKAHPLLLKYDNRVKQCNKENIAVSTDLELLNLRVELKKQNYQKSSLKF